MLVQFGYVTLFSSAFPLAALCALLNNIIEIRSDAFKLCFTFQRPFGQRVESIGTWQVCKREIKTAKFEIMEYFCSLLCILKVLIFEYFSCGQLVLKYDAAVLIRKSHGCAGDNLLDVKISDAYLLLKE